MCRRVVQSHSTGNVGHIAIDRAAAVHRGTRVHRQGTDRAAVKNVDRAAVGIDWAGQNTCTLNRRYTTGHRRSTGNRAVHVQGSVGCDRINRAARQNAGRAASGYNQAACDVAGCAQGAGRDISPGADVAAGQSGCSTTHNHRAKRCTRVTQQGACLNVNQCGGAAGEVGRR